MFANISWIANESWIFKINCNSWEIRSGTEAPFRLTRTDNFLLLMSKVWDKHEIFISIPSVNLLSGQPRTAAVPLFPQSKSAYRLWPLTRLTGENDSLFMSLKVFFLNNRKVHFENKDSLARDRILTHILVCFPLLWNVCLWRSRCR